MSTNASDRVIAAKNALVNALGDNEQKYFTNMKFWFRHKWTKEEFDLESRKYLTAETMHLHNQFLLAILNKLEIFQKPDEPRPTDSFTSHADTNSGTNANNKNSKKRKRSSKAYAERINFEPYDVLDFMGEDNLECIQPAEGTEANTQIMPTQRYCVQELFLPDAGFIMGRFLIGAWEIGLVNVEDSVAEYVASAVQVLLKNIISSIIMKRKHYKVTGEGSYYYDIGAPLRDPTLRNTVTRQKVDDSPLELDKEITSPNFMRRPNDDGIFLAACEEIYPQKNNRITLRDARNALSDRNIIASHATYIINMERITQMMH